ncbi:MAG: hypothetical protein AB7E29_01020 [Xanthobacter sp.]
MNRLSDHPHEKDPHKARATDEASGDACLTPAAASQMLDEELDQSFPASDPPSMVRAPHNLCADPAQEERERAAEARELAHESALLDEALDESFPASDPPAPAQPHLHHKDGTRGDGPPGKV